MLKLNHRKKNNDNLKEKTKTFYLGIRYDINKTFFVETHPRGPHKTHDTRGWRKTTEGRFGLVRWCNNFVRTLPNSRVCRLNRPDGGVIDMLILVEGFLAYVYRVFVVYKGIY